MKIISCPIVAVELVATNIYVLSFDCPEVASIAMPGQFINILVNNSLEPLFRRPFSIYHVEGNYVKIIFNVRGTGTGLLALKKPGEHINILAPLGCSYGVTEDFETAIFVGGGLGIAPLPMLASAISPQKKILSFIGARSKEYLVTQYLPNLHIATDDGSMGYKGNVVALLREYIKTHPLKNAKIFSCGPNIMLESLGRFASEENIPCEVSLESPMACGIGICQGCPVERVNYPKKYSLVCKEGTVFDSRTIKFSAW